MYAVSLHLCVAKHHMYGVLHKLFACSCQAAQCRHWENHVMFQLHVHSMGCVSHGGSASTCLPYKESTIVRCVNISYATKYHLAVLINQLKMNKLSRRWVFRSKALNLNSAMIDNTLLLYGLHDFLMPFKP